MNNRHRQRAKLAGYTFTKKQIWNADDTMAKFILALLKEFKKSNRWGYPNRDEETNTPEKWEAILDRLIYTFDQLAHDYPDSPHNKAYIRMNQEHPNQWGFVMKESKDGCHRLEEKHSDIYDQYITPEVKDKEKAYQEDLQEGLMLFAKYFRDLWD